MSGQGGPGESYEPRILFVCTANRCRSPMAAALLRRDLAALGLDVDVRSAGLLTPGHAVPTPGRVVAREHGLDVDGTGAPS